MSVASILLVDDDFGILDALSDVLTDEGYDIITARNGREALERIAVTRPDVILLDFMMPIMDGGQTLQALQADPSLRSIPVIMMSAVSKASLPLDCQPTAFIAKPFEIKSLLEQLERILGTAAG